jgi:hypothetical protein
MFTPIPNHVQAALARLITQYQQSPNIQGLIASIVTPIQDIENALTDMNNLRYLPDATGAQLDVIGVIVGLPRAPGTSDAQYLLQLYGQIKINTSQGQPEQAIQTFMLFTGVSQVRLFETPPGQVIFNSTYNPPNAQAVSSLFQTLLDVLPAGVRPSEIVVMDPVSPFSYAGNVAPRGGYGTVSDSSVGGKYGFLIRQNNGPFGYGVSNAAIQGYGTRRDSLVGGEYSG